MTQETAFGAVLLALLAVLGVLVGIIKHRGRQTQEARSKVEDLTVEKAKAEAERDVASATDEELGDQLADVLARRRPPTDGER